jgi:hypothetical protein
VARLPGKRRSLILSAFVYPVNEPATLECQKPDIPCRI